MQQPSFDVIFARGGIVPPPDKMERGGIVGSVEIVDCVDESDSPWFFGRYGYVLRDPRPLPFWPCKGQLGFFTRDWPEHIRANLREAALV